MEEQIPKAEKAQLAAAAPPQYSDETMKMLVQLMLGEQAEKIQAKQEAKARHLLTKEETRKMVAKFTADRAAAQARCNHTSEDNRFTLIRGQVHNDGMHHPICVRCLKEFPPRRPLGEEIETAVSS